MNLKISFRKPARFTCERSRGLNSLESKDFLGVEKPVKVRLGLCESKGERLLPFVAKISAKIQCQDFRSGGYSWEAHNHGEGQRLKMKIRSPSLWHLIAATMVCSLAGTAQASLGDRLPEFRECVKVSLSGPKRPLQEGSTHSPAPQVCKEANCENDPTPIRMQSFVNFK